MIIDYIADAAGKKPTREEFEGLTWSFYQFGKIITAAQYQLSWANLQRLSRQIAAWQQAYDAWITPVLATSPMKIGTFNFEETDLMKVWVPIANYVPLTALQNITGQPAISLPLACSNSGLPIGVQFVGRFGEEHLLLSLRRRSRRLSPGTRRGRRFTADSCAQIPNLSNRCPIANIRLTTLSASDRRRGSPWPICRSRPRGTCRIPQAIRQASCRRDRRISFSFRDRRVRR